ncbi:P-loop containing nucleoside triphosphate hydrolase protein [Westerdykella ornata]|uniref:P-loop containing nucleoside triphosphate hydrolase protein n=1 Tax=Westerdykella ornata TaxID=318751 RepID=A0A6A6JX16_WESOR|nr:P-loop containing nucleoside triphosphate hydrolase protein [Westerdykella ornata]KAF2280358.1 P-loop containing nucleoside triphosphate hydrolase protein [Westerdykella ornata]
MGLTIPAMPLMALILGRLTANITGFGKVGSTASPSQFMSQISANALWFVYLFIAKFILVYIWGLGFTFTANRTVQALRLTCLRRVLHRSVVYHDAKTPGSLSSTITAQCDAIQASLADRTGVLIQALSMLISAFAVAFSQSWQLTIVMLAVVVLTMALMGFIVGNDQKLEAKLLKRYEECSLIAEDALGSIKTVVAFGAVNKFLAKYDIVLAQAQKVGKKKGPLVGMMFASQYFFMLIAWAIGFWFGAYLYTHGHISDPGRILAVFFSTLIGLGGTMVLGPNVPLFVKAVAAAGHVFELLDNLEGQDEEASEETLPALSGRGTSKGHLQLQNVTFAYPSRPDRNALSNINLRFTPGTSTAVVGPSGAGKSTLISLLERWLVPTSGTILIDDHDISSVSVKWLRSQIALVQQEPQLFNASIFDNIAHGLSGTDFANASPQDKARLVEDACREARATEFIEKLPKASPFYHDSKSSTDTLQGLETNVGDQGSLLSGGQKQRIAIARALIGQRPILLMDEATSALDNENSKVIESLMTRSSNCTTIFISHKIRSAMRADLIVVLDEGRVAEQGTHDHLMRADGLYKRLYDTQTSREPEQDDIEQEVEILAQKEPVAVETSAVLPDLIERDVMFGSDKRSLFSNVWEITKENRHYWPIFLIGLCACVFTAQPFPAQGILLGRVLEVFQGPTDKISSKANFYASMFLVVGFGALISYSVMGFFLTILGVHILKFYRLEYFRAVLLQRMDFFDCTSSGLLVSRLSSDPSNLQELIGINLGLLMSMFIQVISAAIIGLAFSWKFALVGIFGAQPVVFAAGYVRFKLDSALVQATTSIFEDSARFASDALSAIRTVKAFTLEPTVQETYQQHLSSTIGTLQRKTATIMLFFALSESIELLALALSFWYGGRLLSRGELSTASFFTVFIAVIFGGQAAGAIFGYTSNVSKAKLAASNILSMRHRVQPQSKPELPENAAEPKDTDVAVHFRNVSFSYPARQNVPVLKDISLRILHGQTVAIVGSSGSGKSTLLALLERFYDVQSGTLEVFGKPVSHHDLDSYRRRLAYVPQEPRLYRGSIRDNVVLGVDEDIITEADVAGACDAANLTDLIASLPEGYSSECGGVSLSGGQKQRVAIARALIRNPDILLLDEPTSALDAESEKMVQDTLQSIGSGGGRTMIIVTHRLNTIRHADTIFVMSAGQIVERGTHAELMAQRGSYFRMFQSSRSD